MYISIYGKIFTMNKRGFTLIELLVVISIISLLASIATSSLNSARAKGRDALRIQQMLEIQKAIEMYYADHGEYPSRFNPGATPPYDEFDTIDTDDNIPSADPYSCSNGNTSCWWTESTEPNFLWQLWDTSNNGGKSYLPNKPADPYEGTGNQYAYEYYYGAVDGTAGWSPDDCFNAKGSSYVLAVQGLESVTSGQHSSSPGFVCATFDPSTWFDWVTGNTTR
jgi:prepilin-type N-terminal cleavage/methylation domain-containing protein